MAKWQQVAVVAAVVLLGAGCGKLCTPVVSPSNASVLTCTTQQLSAKAPDGCTPGVSWAVAAADAGTVDASGLYTAPKQVPAPAQVSVAATSLDSPGAAGHATLTLSTALPSTVT